MLPLKDSQTISRIPFWTVIIILVNIYVFYLELTAPNTDQLIESFALIPSQVSISNITSLLPFITSQFLHAGFIHIISNLLFLWVFGNNVEGAFKFFYFPLFYILSGIVAGLTQYAFNPSDSIPMLGASGAVAGVLGAYLALFPYHKIKTLVFIFIFITIIDIPAYLLLFFWFITQFFSGMASISMTQSSGGIAFLPHIGGFLFGFFAAILTIPAKRLRFKFM